MATLWGYTITSYTNEITGAKVTFDIIQDGTKVATKTLTFPGGKSKGFIEHFLRFAVIQYKNKADDDTWLTAVTNVETPIIE